ncbi:MAG: methyltransferase domain-containing protein [Alphaproteobacteria bacterium]
MKTDDLGGQTRHDMMADPDHDSYSRERFVQEYVWQINGNYHQGNYALYDTKLKPRDGSDMSVQEQRKKVLAEPYGQMWSSLRRVAREWTCEAVGPTVERQLDDLIGKARQYRQSNRKLGSLMLDPSVKVPGYVDVDIHLKPGGYHTELTEDDVFAGAEYERTTYMNTNGLLGPRMDKLGKQVADWVKVTYPKMKPKRILEMGCTIGQSTIAWKEAFPDAEVYGIDVAAPSLRYAHARAEALGRGIEFSQQDATKTNFPDGFFDIVASHAMIHETSRSALRGIFAESHRILKPGGLMLHNDGTPFRDMKHPIDRLIPDWDTHYNAEPFITQMRSMDLAEFAVEAGWPKGSTSNSYAEEAIGAAAARTVSGGACYMVVGRR